MKKEKTRIIIADDHQMFIDGIKALLETMDVEVIGEANNGKELLALVNSTPVDLILMDVNMPEMDGVEATKAIREAYPDLPVLMLTMHSSRDYIQRLLRAGASGYVLKNTGREELQEAITTVMAGNAFFSEEVSQRIMEGLQKKKSQEREMVVELTPRELDVLKLIAQEMTSNEIAEKLFISHHTVETHRKNLISKLNVRGSAGLVKYAILQGLVD
ncbi:MAG: response regulator transcription factor [Cryomorphaceae bacterium]